MSLPTAGEIERTLSEPEVQEMMRRLATRGLGVFLPHMHTNSDALAPLPSGVVQFEADLQVSFVSEDDAEAAEAVPVGWIWDEGVRVVGRCRQGHTVTRG